MICNELEIIWKEAIVAWPGILASEDGGGGGHLFEQDLCAVHWLYADVWDGTIFLV
jgi:hypothetical protein